MQLIDSRVESCGLSVVPLALARIWHGFHARIYALSGRAEAEATAIGHISRLLGCDCRGG